ncbi:MAG: Sugar O-acyltransferase, sialic acid O-acetyltransferase NeuD family [Candidatus Peregrinibacteria bacterium Greene0416_19]|nr:MAG: Sugar O-acyltransferase, sialic acid O-acetyltransferase NeuD family [Candidatus Peregrinibacteria bacterium Greene0416_19]
MRKLVIIGSGAQSIDILETVHAINERQPTYALTGFLDDDVSLRGKEIFGLPILGPIADGASLPSDTFFVSGIGLLSLLARRPAIIARTGVSPDRFATIIHPSATVSRWCSVGKGSVILQHATVTAQASIGDQVMILAGGIISHHVSIGDYCILAGGSCVSGRVTVGPRTYIGTNASIRESLTIGSDCIIGMGAVVLEHVPDGRTVVGNPARTLPRQ